MFNDPEHPYDLDKPIFYFDAQECKVKSDFIIHWELNFVYKTRVYKTDSYVSDDKTKFFSSKQECTKYAIENIKIQSDVNLQALNKQYNYDVQREIDDRNWRVKRLNELAK